LMTFNANTFTFSVLRNKALTLKQVQCQHKSELLKVGRHLKVCRLPAIN
jgi:hypothetical protein